MKKFLLFTVVLYVLFLLSFRENSSEAESFEKILKDHPERIQELLNVAKIYQDTVLLAENLLSKEDILSSKELQIFRNKMEKKKGDKKEPVVIISTQAIQALIQNHLNKEDSLVFFLGKYSENDPKRIRRYNDRNTRMHNFGKDTLTLDILDKRVAFAMQVFTTVSPMEEDMKTSTGLFNPTKIIGSPGYNPIDFEKSDRTNHFKTEKKPVSELFEISRLCPPPREGCF